ncbi:hypothetical protein J2S00_002911 [Caldalkalibacillus uzonensis]|uniref:Uncharacterized protein n=1 Tax=Caldalkalibacillus uzonensis TaxID=353224 RepID=A0ABU0CUM0_9BACI|nr:hypothetical protein [Caldalkalibacillus uzonensis]MDQ0340116.1 hypothetical protein [Caldalkalibacillus uzonensis]
MRYQFFLIGLTAVFVLFLQTTTVYAHKLLIEPVSPGKIKVVYEDGSFSTRTMVQVFDTERNEIESGHLDSEGYFYYDEERANLIVADDGIGHRTEWTVGEEVIVKSDPHRWLTVGMVVVVFVVVAAYFSYRTKKKRNM